METVKIYCVNTDSEKEIPMGTSVAEMIDIFGVRMPYLIANAKVNNKTESLAYKVYRPKRVEYVDISHSSAMRTYIRSLCFILAKAVNDVVPDSETFLEHPVEYGFYFEIEAPEKVSDETLAEIRKRMHEIVDADFPFQEMEDETKNVVRLFREGRHEDKALLLETSDLLYAHYFMLDDYLDYYYGCLTPSTGYIQLFEIHRYNGGFILQIPMRFNPTMLAPVTKQPKLMSVYKEHLEFLKISNLDNVGDLNKANIDGRISEVIQVAEAYQAKQISEIADEISKKFNDGLRLVLISGPSSSGKTTFRKRLEVQLRVEKLSPIGLSLDDYFVERDKTPLDEFGEKDYESLYSLDLDLLESHLLTLFDGNEVELPCYNFITGKREYRNNRIRMTDNTIFIVEGIHALNPQLTVNIPREKKFHIYVSALTAISLDNHNWIPASDNRLLRRLVRDYRYRGYSGVDTLSRWESVLRGEYKWIFPFQENADVMFNSAMIYELAAIRKHAEPILQRVPRTAPEFAEAHRLLKFLSYFNYIPDRELPPTSLLREFLGGSSFRY